MSSIFIKNIVGQNDFAVPEDDTALATATSELDSILSGVSNFSYDKIKAWVRDSGGPNASDGNRYLGCMISGFTYNGEVCPSETEIDTMVSAIETALENDADITSIGKQYVDINSFKSSDEFLQNITSNIWSKPLYPRTEDDEFNDSSMDSSWSVYNVTASASGSFSSGNVDAYDNTFNSGNVVRVEPSPVTRKSWALLQVPASGDVFAITKSYTFATDILVLARLKFSQRTGTYPSNDHSIGISFWADDGSGDPDNDNRIWMMLNETDSGIVQSEFIENEGGSASSIGASTDVNAEGQALEYVAIHKIGTTFHGWVGTNAGNWIYMGSTTFSATLAHVGIVAYNTDLTPGPKIMGVDFIRFYETDNFLL